MRSRKVVLDLTEAEYDALVAAVAEFPYDATTKRVRRETLVRAGDKLIDGWYGRARGSLRENLPA